MRFQPVAGRVILAPVLGLVLAAAVVACSSSGSSSTSSPGSSSPATSATSSAPATGNAAAQITANWEKFFSSSTPTSQRVALLQNGTAFATAIGSLTHLVNGLGATVTAVTVNSPTSATVTYNLTAGGSSLLTHQTGTAVYENGVWKVGDASMCGLLKLAPGATLPAACSSAS
jgi:purine-cytosine permease-like protein